MTSIQTSIDALASAFPVGANKKRADLLIKVLQRKRHKPVDIAEAVRHLTYTRDQPTFPAVASFFRAISYVRNQRLEQAQSPIVERPLTADEQDQVRKMRQLGNAGLYWCGDRADFASDPRSKFMVGERYQEVTRDGILKAWQRKFEGGSAPPELVGSTEDQALEDLF